MRRNEKWIVVLSDDFPDLTPTPSQFARNCLAKLIDAADMIADHLGEQCLCEDGYPESPIHYECPMCAAQNLKEAFRHTFGEPYDLRDDPQ